MTYQLREKLIQIAKDHSHTDDPSHDFFHVLRVLQNAEHIARHEGGDSDIIIPAALFHDVVNYPKTSAQSRLAPQESADWTVELLQGLDEYPDEKIPEVYDAIRSCSFTNGLTPGSLEGKILQDADSLESIGAIAIMRTFSSGGMTKRPFYHPDDPFFENRERDPEDKVEYMLDLFYWRLLIVIERIHTPTAKKLAEPRTQYLHQFLEQLKKEILETGTQSN